MDVNVGAATAVLFNFAAPVPVHAYVYVGVPVLTVAVIGNATPEHVLAVAGVITTVGTGFITTSNAVRALSQVLTVCDTQ